MATANSDTLAGYIIRIRQWLHEVSPTKSYYTEALLKRLFNSNYRRRCAQLVMAHEGYFTMVATRDLVADQAKYAWPPGHQRNQKLELVRTDGDTVPITAFERHYSSNSTASTGGDSYSPTWRPISGGFVLEPAPNETVTGGVRIEYTGLPALLTDDDDSMHTDFPRSFDELAILDTVVAALDSEGLAETGMTKTVLRQRQEFEWDFLRFIDQRVIRVQKVDPFIAHYSDS
jgi:hypothetical protein